MRNLFAATAVALLFSASAQAATNIQAQQSTITYSTTGGVTSGFRNYTRATSTVVYDAATDTYTLRDTGNLGITSSFAPSNIDAGSSNATFTVYTKNSGTETLRLLNQGAGNPLIQLTYVDYGEWRRTTTASGTTSVNDTYVVFGSKTPAGSVPHSGSASYTTIYDGNFVDKNGAHALDGSGTMTADFGAATLSYTASINGVPSTPLAFSGTGSINFRSAGFTTINSSSGYTLTQNGNFYGPAVDEVGGLFRLKGTAGQGEGAFVGN